MGNQICEEDTDIVDVPEFNSHKGKDLVFSLLYSQCLRESLACRRISKYTSNFPSLQNGKK